METVPGWLIDAVAAAGIATAYAHHYDALIEQGVRHPETHEPSGAAR